MSTIEHTENTILNNTKLARRISELLHEKGSAYSIRAFSEKVGINREQLRRMLIGELHIPPSKQERIAEGLKISVERLKQTDTQVIEKELASLLDSNKRTKVMMMRANDLATQWAEVALGATERGFSLNALGRVQFLDQKYEEAHQTWLRSLEYAKKVYQEFEDSQLLHIVTANLMLSYTVLKEYSNLEEMLLLVEQAFPEEPNALGMVFYSRMKMQEDRGNLELAKKHAYRSLEHFEQTTNEKQLARALINVAHFEYLDRNFKTSARALSAAIEKVQHIDNTLIFAVKEYVKALIKLRDFEKASRVVAKYESLAKEYPDYWAKFQIMKTTLEDDPNYAASIIEDSNMSSHVRYLACMCLFEYYVSKDDAETAMHYYKKERIYSNNKNEFVDEEGF